MIRKLKGKFLAMVPNGLSNYLKQHKKLAVAFSGGVDSAYLLYAAKICGVEVAAYFVKTEFQPEFELMDAVFFSKQYDIDLRIIRLSVLGEPDITKNSSDRCYHCKKVIFKSILKACLKDGFLLLADGSNFDDKAEERPGMRAISELNVISPLRDCRLTKLQIRRYSKSAGLFTFDKPSYSCLATRIMNNAKISYDKLRLIDSVEQSLFSMGFSDFRARLYGDGLLLQFTDEQLPYAKADIPYIRENLMAYSTDITIDDTPRKGLTL
ncbi:MAG: ATP-dependent sacrificial sulfur transferase LarE [Clostridia bacterium]|nr:ATP-dependent sacrificial sulfur transferase LarE [Clostridia bacterium]